MKALVIGASGGSGQAIVRELLERGIQTVLLGRDLGKLREMVRSWGDPDGLELVEGDVFDSVSLVPHFRRVDLVFQAANVGYQEMTKKLLPLGESVMRASEETGRKVVFVDGVYVYGPNPGRPVSERDPLAAHTRKGRAKVEFERLVFSDSWKMAKALIVRLPDYYGPTSQLAYLNPTLEGLAKGRFGIFFGSLKPAREYVYLPDAAKMIVEISLREDSYGQNWNIPGSTIRGVDILDIVRSILRKRFFVFPIGKGLMKFMGFFDSFCKEVVEIMYLMEDPLVLSGEKYAREIGPIPRTSFREGLRITLESISNKKNRI